MGEITINVAKDFSRTPGSRFYTDGPYSGEAFREAILKPAFEEALQSNSKLKIIFDGGYGYAPSFLEEAFGGLARLFGADEVLSTIVMVSEEEPGMYERIKKIVQEVCP